MLFWSLACASHGLATSVGTLAFSRLLPGLGEGGGFPAATRAVAEWFPVTERATPMGIVNAGTAVGGVLAPPLIALVLTTADWRAVFYLTGAVGRAWACWWWIAYQPPERHPRLLPDERRLLEPVIGAGRSLDAPPRWLTLLACARPGARRLEVPQRCGVVLLPVLAAEVSLRCTRVRHQGSGRLRLDSVCRGRRGLPRRRIALKLAVTSRGPAQHSA